MSDKSSWYDSRSAEAQYIEAGWGDFFSPLNEQVVGNRAYALGHRTVEFYKGVVNIVAAHVERPRTICDIGSATGRVAWELSHKYPSARILACEPSRRLSDAAEAIVLGHDVPEFVPLPAANARGFDFTPLPSSLREIASKPSNVTFFACLAEDVPRPSRHFDLITCLNVVDRHPVPAELVKTLKDLLAVEGYLVLSSPLDWKDDITAPRDRVTDLRHLFSADFNILRSVDQEYQIRKNDRYYVSYQAQVVVAQRVK